MSSNSYRQMSTRVIILVCILIVSISCVRNRPDGTETVSDRLTNFLLMGALTIGDDYSPLKSDLDRCSAWIRTQLELNPGQHFRLDSGHKALVADGTGAQLMLSPDVYQPLDSINQFFHLNSAVDRKIFNMDNLRVKLKTPEVKETLKKLISDDMTRVTSETGGVVLLDPHTQTLQFHVIQSDNERWYKHLSEQDNPVDFVMELKRIQRSLPYLKVRTQRTLSIIENESETQEEQYQEMARYLDLLLTHSKYSYILDQGTQYSAIANAALYGYYMGVFHVHPPDNPPSIEDKLGSFLRKNFVIVPRGADIEVHYLDFTADFSAEPQVIQL